MIFAFAREQPRKQSMQKPRREQALFFWAWNRKRFPNFQELWCGSCFWVWLSGRGKGAVICCICQSLPPFLLLPMSRLRPCSSWKRPRAQAKSKAKPRRKNSSAGGAEAPPQPRMDRLNHAACGKFRFLSAAPLLTPCVGKRADSSNNALGSHQCVHVSKRFGG